MRRGLTALAAVLVLLACTGEGLPSDDMQGDQQREAEAEVNDSIPAEERARQVRQLQYERCQRNGFTSCEELLEP